MNTPALDPHVSVSLGQSGMFLPPGRPRPLARRLAIHNRVVRRLRHFLEIQGFQEVPVPDVDARMHLSAMLDKGFPAVWCESQAVGPETGDPDCHLPQYKLITTMSTAHDLDGLCDLMEQLLKDVTRALGAELLGGRHVTRLDRTLPVPHPRLTHTEAVGAVGIRGWEVDPQDDLPQETEASLIRYCGNLPVMVTHWPSDLKPGHAEAEPGLAARVKYYLPYAGEVMDGGVWAGPSLRSGFGLGVARLLQYLMGLGSITDTEILRGSGPGLLGSEAAE